ncbi:MAG: hypothetical protein QM791_04075 [Ferruginibacter sp.]
MSANTLLLSDVIIKERSIVHGNIDPKLIYPDIKVAQDLYVLPILGTALFKKLQSCIESGNWTGSENYKALLDEYIIDALVNFTMAELPMNSYQFTNKGVIRKQGENTDLPSMSDLLDVARKYKDRGEAYAKRLRLYLIEKAPTMFPEYLNPGNTIDTIVPEQNDFTMPVFLGDDENKCCGPGSFYNKPYSE